MCLCEMCEPCFDCGHRADEHIAGDGHCYKCGCSQFNPLLKQPLLTAWSKLKLINKTISHSKFVEKWIETNGVK